MLDSCAALIAATDTETFAALTGPPPISLQLIINELNNCHEQSCNDI